MAIFVKHNMSRADRFESSIKEEKQSKEDKHLIGIQRKAFRQGEQ